MKKTLFLHYFLPGILGGNLRSLGAGEGSGESLKSPLSDFEISSLSR